MAQDDTSRQSVAVALSELLKASADLWTQFNHAWNTGNRSNASATSDHQGQAAQPAPEPDPEAEGDRAEAEVRQAPDKNRTEAQAQWIEMLMRHWWAGSPFPRDPPSATEKEDVHQRSSPHQETVDSINHWQSEWHKLFWSMHRIYGFGASADATGELEKDAAKIKEYQEALQAFLELMTIPVKEKFQAFSQAQGADVKTEAEPRPDSGTIYDQWMRELEQRYAELFASPQFVETLQRVIHAAVDTHEARGGLVANFLKAASIPTREDYDRLLREFHELKRTVREFARRRSNAEPGKQT